MQHQKTDRGANQLKEEGQIHLLVQAERRRAETLLQRVKYCCEKQKEKKEKHCESYAPF